MQSGTQVTVGYRCGVTSLLRTSTAILIPVVSCYPLPLSRAAATLLFPDFYDKLKSVMKAVVTLLLALVAVSCAPVARAALSDRKQQVLHQHACKPFPKAGNAWGDFEQAFAKLALNGTTNASVAAAVNREILSWPRQYLPFDNYSVTGPCSGLGELPVLTRMAILPLTRSLLTPEALTAVEDILFAWLSPRSKVDWAGKSGSWLLIDGSENLDATRKGNLYLSALALNMTYPDRIVELDGNPVWQHAQAWETHWRVYLNHRAFEGIGVEMGSPTYAKYAIQNFLNIADLSPNLGALAGDFLHLWFADAAQAFLPRTGKRGGAHNRVYRDESFFIGRGFEGFTWLYGWWASEDRNRVKEAIDTPELVLFATSSWKPLPIVTAIATNTSSTSPYIYQSRRLGNSVKCSQPLGPVNPYGTKYGNVSCSKSPCKPCLVCGGVLALWKSACDTLSASTSVVKQEFVGASRKYTLGAIHMDWTKEHEQYVAGVLQNHQVGAFFGGSSNFPRARLVFGDSGSINCSSPGFQRHSYGGLTSRLVPGAMAVTRPTQAKINPCASGPPCKNSDFPVFAFVTSELHATKTTAGDWICFNSKNETYACLAITGGQHLTDGPIPCTNSGLAAWNGTLLLFNGSSTSKSIGVMQMGTFEDQGSFEHFIDTMRSHKIADSTDNEGNLVYTSLGGDVLKLGVGGISDWKDLPYSYSSPYIFGRHPTVENGQLRMDVTLMAPGFQNATLSFQV